MSLKNQKFKVRLGVKRSRSKIFYVALLLFTFLSIALALPSFQKKDFTINSHREQYLPSQDIYLFISGPGRTGFKVNIFNSEGILVSQKTEKTNSRGLTYIHLSGFSTPGRYVIELTPFSPSSSQQVVNSSFRILEPEIEMGCENCRNIQYLTTTTTVTTTITTTSATPSMTLTITTMATIMATSSSILPSSITLTTTTTTTTTTTIPKESITAAIITRELILTPKKEHFSVNEEPEFELKIKESNFVEGIGRVTSFISSKKIDVWVEDAFGKKLELAPKIEVDGGSYWIKIQKERKIKPGLYKLVSKVGSSETQETWFKWGLVSVNTKKSIYKPGETAEILMVVLDKEGHLVSGANVSLKIIDLKGNVTTYSTSSGTITELERGIYQAYYQTMEEGNYSLFVTATSDVTVSIESHFLVKKEYDFDILREIPVTIDPRRGAFQSKIKVISYNETGQFTLKESLPKEFDVVYFAEGAPSFNVVNSKNEKIIIWENLTNGSEVSYKFQRYGLIYMK
jgi:hypothetical protein